ncbi:MAG: hypothetical protein ACM3SQ_09180 [Betaproteobacteria bacterium]
MLPSAAFMSSIGRSMAGLPGPDDPYHGLFRWHSGSDGAPRVSRHEAGPAAIPCPTTGRLLRISTVEVGAAAICASCGSQGFGGFVSFEGDLRMAYACPQCRRFIWLVGA